MIVDYNNFILSLIQIQKPDNLFNSVYISQDPPEILNPTIFVQNLSMTASDWLSVVSTLGPSVFPSDWLFVLALLSCSYPADAELFQAFLFRLSRPAS